MSDGPTHVPNTIDYVEFPASDRPQMARARQFFSAVFGWSFKEWGDDYIDTATSGIMSGMNADSTHRTARPLVVVYVEDLEVAHARVVAAGGQITRPIFSFPGGRRFHFTDPAGHELGVWSDRT